MDEATASIDYQTEKIIQTAMKKLFKDSTVLTIAHRIETITSYDKVLILNKGEVEAFDTPTNLKHKLNCTSVFK